MQKWLKLSAIALLGLSVTGCATASKRLGLTKSAPNEFNILTKAPLVVPPEYNLRPPAIGEASAENNYSQKAARQALLGSVDDAEPSEGEIMLMREAGVGRANREIRLEIDGENGVERKTNSFSDRVLFWQNGKMPTAAPIDPDVEAKRLEAISKATGGAPVTISRRPGGAKIPGL